VTTPATPTVVRGLLDTSVVIELDQLSADLLPQEPTISSITMAELAAGPHATDDMNERARRQEQLQRAESLLVPLPFDAAAARVYGRVYAATRSLGRKPRDARTIDLLIASVALANNLPLFTRNPDDFAHLRGVGLEVYAI
jgi:predicted nucleic acid-binding protein